MEVIATIAGKDELLRTVRWAGICSMLRSRTLARLVPEDGNQARTAMHVFEFREFRIIYRLHNIFMYICLHEYVIQSK